MKKLVKQLIALLLTLSLAMSMLPASALAAALPENQESSSVSDFSFPMVRSMESHVSAEVQPSVSTYSVEEVEGIIAKNIFAEEETTFDMSAYGVPEQDMIAMTDEVLGSDSLRENIQVTYDTDDNGNVTTMEVEMDSDLALVKEEIRELTANAEPITDEEMQQILYWYNEYNQLLLDNPQYFGVKTPYFSTKTTENSPLGDLLSMANIQQEAIDEGAIDFDTLNGTIMLFYLGNRFGMELYGDTLLSQKNAALQAVEDSSADTDIQKLLALNSWLTHNCTFDMSYLMNIEAPEPQKREKEDDLNAAVVAFLGNMIEQQYIQGYMEQAGMTQEEAASAVENDPDTMAEIQQQAEAAAPDITDGILGLWKGSLFGALCEGNAVCMGYTAAYTYLIQWLYGDVYHPNGDGNNASDWVTPEQVNPTGITTDSTADQRKAAIEQADYMVDTARINFDSVTSMYGDKYDFSSEHYWNAVKVNGTWYYIDTSYTDSSVETMMRDRVETDGSVNHMYFMLSDTTCRELYDGYYSTINTLYQRIATDTSYEHTWFSYAKSNLYSQDGKWYYYYDSTDVISGTGQIANNVSPRISTMAADYQDAEHKLVYHDAGDSDGENTFVTLIDFEEAQVLNPASGELEDSPMIAELYAEQEAYEEKYPSIAVSCALYHDLLYFSISNCILSYNLNTGELVKVKEYNEVTAYRDLSVAMGGMAFYTDKSLIAAPEDDSKSYTVQEHPIASMTIKEDGTLYVAIATNYAYISGKGGLYDSSSNGYEYEETNYNSSYNYYLYEKGVTQESNDNDEFMWSADFVDILSMDDLTGKHSYEDVTIAETCTQDAYTESRCTVCGRINSTVSGVSESHNGSSQVETEEVQEIQPEEVPEVETPVVQEEPAQEEENTQEELPAVEKDDPVTEEEEETAALDLLSANVEGDTEELPAADASQPEPSEEAPADPADEEEAEAPDQSEPVEEETPDQQEPSGDASQPEENEAEPSAPDVSQNTEEDKGTNTAPEVAEESSAGHGHRWVKMEETYYTKDDDGNYNGGTVYVCLDCLDTSDKEPEDGEIVTIETSSVKRSWYWAMTQDMDGNEFMGATLEEKTTNDTTPKDAVQEQYNKRYWVQPEEEFNGSCMEGGTITYTAAIHGQTDTKTETVEAVGEHSYHSPAEEDFQWSEDYQTCQVHLVCTRGDSDTMEECPVVISQTAPTCTEKGNTVYTASYTYASNSTVSSTRTVADGEPALGHEYDETGRCIRCDTLLKLDTPKQTSVANSAAGVVLQWEKVANAAGYRVYHKVNGKGSWVVLADLSGGDTTSYTDTDVQSGTLYTYTVRAYWGDIAQAGKNTYQKPYWSSYDTNGLSITYLSIPTMGSLTTTASGITVKWGEVTGAAGYAVYRKEGSATSWTKVKTITGGSTVKWTDTDTANGTKYTYTVRAYSKTNKGTVWGSYKATKTTCFVTRPAISSLTKGSKKFTVKWSKNAKATGYQIQYSTSKNFSNAKTVKITKNSTVSKTVSSLSKKKTYYVRIRAYKTVSGTNYYSPWSGSKTVKTK